MTKISFKNYHYLIIFCAICISRVLFYIGYAEDIDSLRFALSIIDEFSIAKNQPHFPAYPVFVFTVKLMYLITQNVGVSFSIIGSLGIFLIAYSAIEINKLYQWIAQKWFMVVPILISPLFFIMSTRYMADMLGLGVLTLSCLYFIKAHKNQSYEFLFYISVGLLAGTRLSFLPLLIVPSILLFIKSEKKVLNGIVGLASVGIWLIPIILLTGWNELIELALYGTNGHFNEWGGSVKTDPHYGLRFLRMIQFIWSDGLGLWWFDRHWILLPASIVFVIGLFKGFTLSFSKEIKVLLIGFVVYALWAYFYQNVLYKPRHILPLTLPLLLVFSVGITKLPKLLSYGLFSVFILSQGFLTFKLAQKHQEKNALYKASAYVVSIVAPEDIVSSNNLVAYFLGQFNTQNISFLLPSDLPKKTEKRIITIGTVLPNKKLVEEKTFYHNPYVNRMWYEVVVRIYE